ncbi:hypothetical protein PV379_21045 [Streptomyces caniscabiei]|uniref:hypothetical protein n=1 Tax=Streptomyces caniscabiei TaxID=2746961 RepID=UPI0029BEDB45|nr:hypothetical protein [Streptomyces caniscabiei]MDX2604045.1 hypothetical protein [Streptomyces caniscabiei]MDX2739374.1 hypothetical protein [Streptomyces caniscabiei]MDX2779785.1 hypothetical protein [Streptomyces caniscabiei]
MSILIEFIILGIFACGVAMFVRSMIRRRGIRRNSALATHGFVKFPCRISWEAGTGKKAFTYGKIRAGADGGLRFSRRGGSGVDLPRCVRVHREPSWRAGLVTLRYSVPGKGDIRILLSETDAETIEGLLRI